MTNMQPPIIAPPIIKHKPNYTAITFSIVGAVFFVGYMIVSMRTSAARESAVIQPAPVVASISIEDRIKDRTLRIITNKFGYGSVQSYATKVDGLTVSGKMMDFEKGFFTFIWSNDGKDLLTADVVKISDGFIRYFDWNREAWTPLNERLGALPQTK